MRNTNEGRTARDSPTGHGVALPLASLVFFGVLLLPFLVRPTAEEPPGDARRLVVVSPHNEAIRFEFGQAFDRWHRARYGEPALVDWHNIGGTSEIARYVASEYTAAFRVEWSASGKDWTSEVAASFNNLRIDANPSESQGAGLAARQAFLNSTAGIGIDVFFGGGEYDHSRQASAGFLVPSGYHETKEGRAILETQIPETIGGEKWYDREGRWFGATVSSFGICFNRDVLQAAGAPPEPSRWEDLTHPSLFGRIALSDPTKSGSSAKAFEMVIQEAMASRVAASPSDSTSMAVALAEGWDDGLRTIRLAAANSRYFTDSASKVPIDVALGDAAAGMCIDFYGLYQAAIVKRDSGSVRMGYASPKGGTTVGCDPVSMLRGAPDPELSKRFIEFALSLDGQKLWAYRVGAPGGPVRYALQRLPIRRDFYTAEHLGYSDNPDLNPFDLAASFTYHPEWTGRLFNAIRLLIRTLCMDSGEELKRAWEAILSHGGPPANSEAMTELHRLPDSARFDRISETMGSIRTKVDEIRLAREWGAYFAHQYRLAESLARSSVDAEALVSQASAP